MTQPFLPRTEYPDEFQADWRAEFFRGAARDFRRNKIPPRYHGGFAEYKPLTPQHAALKAKAEAWANGFSRAETTHGLLFRGAVGCGKSFLAACILIRVAERGYTNVEFLNFSKLLMEIKATYNGTMDYSEADLIRSIVEDAHLVCLDDVGAETLTGYVVDRLYLILNGLFELGKPLIVTTNLGIGTNKADMLAAHLGERNFDRLRDITSEAPPFPSRSFRAT